MESQVIKYGEISLRSSLLINGGACIAVLSMASGSSTNALDQLVGPLRIFTFGVFLAALAPGAAYVSQLNAEWSKEEFAASKSEEGEFAELMGQSALRSHKRSTLSQRISAVLVLASVAAFLVGALCAAGALEAYAALD